MYKRKFYNVQLISTYLDFFFKKKFFLVTETSIEDLKNEIKELKDDLSKAMQVIDLLQKAASKYN